IAGREVVDRANRLSCGFKMFSASYFPVLGIQIARGRGFTERDVTGSAPVAVINQTMAARFFKETDPIGQRLLIQEIVPGSPQLGPEIPWEIVGVIANERTASLDGTSRAVVYVPLEQSPTMSISLVVRGGMEPSALSRSITQAVHSGDANQTVTDVRTLD